MIPILGQAIICASAVITSAVGGFSVECASPAPIATPTPIPIVTPAPTPVPTAVPTPTPPSVSAIAAACAESIANGAPLPPCFGIAFFPSTNPSRDVYRRIISPFASPDPRSAAMIQAYFAGGGNVVSGLMWHNGAGQAQYSYGRPLYRASSSDPVVTFHCTLYCAMGSAVGVRIPSRAKPEGGSDAHLAIYEPDGTLLDLWAVSGGPPWANGQTISAGTVAISTIDGTAYSSADLQPGWMRNGVTAGGMVTPAGIITLSELQAGAIAHEIYGVVTCTASNWYAPATQTARVCTDGRAAIPNGALLQYVPDAAAIAASGMSAESKIIAVAMHNYGIRIADTGGSSGLMIQVENQAPFWSFGSGPDPYVAYAQAHGWNHIVNASVDRYIHALSDLNLPNNLRVLAPGN